MVETHPHVAVVVYCGEEAGEGGHAGRRSQWRRGRSWSGQRWTARTQWTMDCRVEDCEAVESSSWRDASSERMESRDIEPEQSSGQYPEPDQS